MAIVRIRKWIASSPEDFILSTIYTRMDQSPINQNFDLNNWGQISITAWKSITKLVIFQSFVAKCCKMRIKFHCEVCNFQSFCMMTHGSGNYFPFVIQNDWKLKISQGYIICILQHFATKLWNIANFATLFQAVMKILSWRVSYQHYQDELNFDGIEFPVTIDKIGKFERQNNISVEYVWFGRCTLPIYLTKEHFHTHVNRLLFSQGTTRHYSLTKDLNKLLYDQNGRKCRMH
jgi:hypothetical protein